MTNLRFRTEFITLSGDAAASRKFPAGNVTIRTNNTPSHSSQRSGWKSAEISGTSGRTPWTAPRMFYR
jgi:hypothetical protein